MGIDGEIIRLDSVKELNEGNWLVWLYMRLFWLILIVSHIDLTYQSYDCHHIRLEFFELDWDPTDSSSHPELELQPSRFRSEVFKKKEQIIGLIFGQFLAFPITLLEIHKEHLLTPGFKSVSPVLVMKLDARVDSVDSGLT